MTPLRPLAACVAALALLAAGACGDAGDGTHTTDREREILDRLADGDDEEDAAVDVEAEREEFMAECLDEAGFEYLPPPDAPSVFDELGLTDEEFRAQYGFGYSTVIDLNKANDERLNRAADEQMVQFESMSEAERTEYHEAERECYEQSYAEFGFPETGNVSLPSDSAVGDYIDRAIEATEQDQRLIDATEAWSECMGDQGYDFADRDDMGLPLEAEAEPFVTAYAEQGQALVDSGRTWAELRVGDVLDADQLAELQALQQKELTIAAAHQVCLDAGHDVDAIYSEVYDEHMAEVAGS